MKNRSGLLSILMFSCAVIPSFAGQTPSGVNYIAASYSGADASIKINACISAVIAAGGGVCDATTLGGYQQMTEQISLGSTSSVSNGIGITLLLPSTGSWVWQNITNGTSCGIMQYSSTSLIGTQPGGGGNRMELEAKSGSDMDAIYCTAPNSAGNYIRAEGFAVWNNQSGSTFANGVVHIQNVVDQSTFERIFAENYYGDVWHIQSACCGAHFKMIQGTSNGTSSLQNGSAGGVPLTLGPGAVRSISISDSGFNAPGSGSPDILTTGKSAVMGVNFYNTYMEGNGAVDSTTPMVIIGQYAGPVHFYGGVANSEQSSLQSTKPVFQNNGFKLDVVGFDVGNTTLGINDVTNKATVSVWDFSGNLGSIPAYTH